MSNKKILVIDDEQDLIKALTVRLEAENYEVIAALDGLEGLNLARKERPDIIILDLMLPKINGFKVARLLKFDENYKKIPIIILTARAEDEDQLLGKELGVDMYLTKPFDEDELLKNIAENISK
ncbi:response regulator transcription factor [candidate division KSB1 bacterium]